MRIVKTPLHEAVMIEPKVFGDDRGFFLESWNKAAYARAGLDVDFVQDNHSLSSKGVLRGLHLQNPNPQGKLVRVVRGSVWDAIVDLRRSSPTFQKWFGVELSAVNKRILWVPPGFAHGFLTLENETEFLYKCSGSYAPDDEITLQWNDPTLEIGWPLAGMEPILSEKDRQGVSLQEIATYP